jgi:pimeloyl-ACP methyl ester carboxylesterase
MKRSKKILIGVLVSLALIYGVMIIIAYLPQETTPIERLVGREDKFIKVKGHTIHYVQQGRGSPLILIHGFACSTHTWKKLMPLLADRYAVYALDLLGFGLSDKPPDGKYDLESQGALMIDFMNTLQIPSATLVGHSMGGVVAAYAALKAPARVNALVLVDAGFYSGGAPAFLKYIFFPLDRIMARQFYTREVRMRSFSRAYYNKSFITDEVIEAYLRPARTPGAVDALAKMMREVGPRTYEGISEHISSPTLIVWGKNDLAVSPQDAERLQKEIKHSRLVLFDECGHMVPEEKPEELTQALSDFLGKIPSCKPKLISQAVMKRKKYSTITLYNPFFRNREGYC